MEAVGAIDAVLGSGVEDVDGEVEAERLAEGVGAWVVVPGAPAGPLQPAIIRRNRPHATKARFTRATDASKREKGMGPQKWSRGVSSYIPTTKATKPVHIDPPSIST